MLSKLQKSSTLQFMFEAAQCFMLCPCLVISQNTASQRDQSVSKWGRLLEIGAAVCLPQGTNNVRLAIKLGPQRPLGQARCSTAFRFDSLGSCFTCTSAQAMGCRLRWHANVRASVVIVMQLWDQTCLAGIAERSTLLSLLLLLATRSTHIDIYIHIRMHM